MGVSATAVFIAIVAVFEIFNEKNVKDAKRREPKAAARRVFLCALCVLW